MDRTIEKAVNEAVDKFLASPRFTDLVHRALFDNFAKAPNSAMPKDRAMFVWALAADAHARWGYSRDEAMRIAPSLMRDLEDACAPWGDADYDWSVGAAREWTAEQLASDEVAQ